MTFYQKYLKRILDIILCSIALVFLFPLFLITAIAIKLSSKGPVFYYSERAGLKKNPFKFYKFRSMHITNKDKGMFVADSDRVFKVGKIIRRLKIDELPQLINVIKGDMSIVGPRPMVAAAVDSLYCGKYEKISDVRPGLTSVASLFDYTVGDSYIDNDAYIKEVLPIKLEMELYYVEHEGFIYDLKLVFRTIFTIIQVLFGKKSFRCLPEYLIISNNDYSKNVKD